MASNEGHNRRGSIGAEMGEVLLLLAFLPLYLIGWAVQGLWWLRVQRWRR